MNVDFIKLLNSLSISDKKEIFNQLQLELSPLESSTKLSEIGNNNFQCPHCKSNNIIKKGLQGTQKFYCKNCKHYFTLKTNTTFAHSHKSFSLWNKYIDLMCKKLSLREIAKELNIHKNTAFLWRHKILSTLSNIKSEKLSGLVEADETYFRESQKGSRNLTREKHRSGKSKLTHNQLCGFYGITQEEYNGMKRKRGLSNNQVCVLTALDRKNNYFGKPVGYGKMKPTYLKSIKSVISRKSTLITDGEPVYKKLNVARHKKLVSGLSKSKVYNLGRIDELHTSMKGLLNGTFRGVATKYLDNYVNYVGMLKSKKLSMDNVSIGNCGITRKSLKRKVAF
jgi:transposase-like protein